MAVLGQRGGGGGGGYKFGRKSKQHVSVLSQARQKLEYVADQGIDPHNDLEDQGYDTVFSISLNGWASMVSPKLASKPFDLWWNLGPYSE